LIPAVQALSQTLEERDHDEPDVEQAVDVPEETTADISAAERMIVEQTNQFRSQEQLAAVKPNDHLKETARYFADFMARTDKYGHQADGKQPFERAENHGYDFCLVAENIAYQFSSTGFTAEELAKKLVSGWKNSPEHRKNMLDSDLTEIGVAVARSSDSPTYFAVQMLGRPQSQAISFQMTNESTAEVEYTVARRGSSKTFPLPPRARRTHQRCRPAKIEFKMLDTTLEVEDGAEYVVRESAGKLKVANRTN
jgi:uncharacterized protein YkwD